VLWIVDDVLKTESGSAKFGFSGCG